MMNDMPWEEERLVEMKIMKDLFLSLFLERYGICKLTNE